MFVHAVGTRDLAGRAVVRQVGEPQRTGPPEQRRKTRCLLDAFEAGRAAALYLVYHSVEGDPIREYYRVLGPGRVEVFIDSTADSYANQKWSHLLCAKVAVESGYVSGDDCHELSVDRMVSSAG